MMKELFGQFESQIQRLQPPIHAKWCPPARPDEIRAAESQLGIPFPDELRELLQCANGQPYPKSFCDPVFPCLRFRPGELGTSAYAWLAPLERIVERGLAFADAFQDIQVDLEAGEPVELVGPTSLHTQVIDIGETDSASTICLDMSPQIGGHVGQVIHLSTQPLQVAVLAESLSSFIEMVLTGYRSNRFRLNSVVIPFRSDD